MVDLIEWFEWVRHPWIISLLNNLFSWNHAIVQQYFFVNPDEEKMIHFDFAVNLDADDRMNYFIVQQYFIVKVNAEEETRYFIVVNLNDDDGMPNFIV